MKAYHIDRYGLLKVGMTLDGKKMDNIFDLEYISPWGEQVLNFLSSPPSIIDIGELNTNNIEAQAESIRKELFPQMPSRYSVMYGCETIEECRKWKEFFGLDDDVKIYEIEYSGPFIKRDAKLLDQNAGVSFGYGVADAVQSYEGLHKYWSGEFTDDPLPELLITLPARAVRIVE